MKSTRWTVNLYDWLKGLIMFVGTPVLTLVQQEIPNWTPWLSDHFGKSGAIIAQAGLGAMITYMLKQLATDDTAVAIKTLAKQDVTIKDNSADAPKQ